jgi:MFS transporter, ACS family, glucarate transporter
LSFRSGGRIAVASIITVNIAYSLNWFNIGSLYYLIGPDLNGGVSGLGTLTSAFFLGIGLLQIPVGILSARVGPRRVLTIGTIIAALAVIGQSVSTNLFEATMFRFIVGAGLAFVFAPSIVMITGLSKGRAGAGVGIIQSSFGVGGLLGLFGWTLLAPLIGWRLSLGLSGVLLILGGLSVALFGPDNETRTQVSFDRLAKILREKSLIMIGLGLLSPNLGSILVFSFMPYYLKNNLGESAAVAGLIASATVVVPILSALGGGRLYDKTRNPRLLMIISGFAISIALALFALANVAIIILGVLLIGLVFGVGTTAGITGARDLNPIEKEYDGLAVSWISMISLTGAFWPPLVFSYLAGTLGYTAAWAGSAIISLSALIPLFFLTKKISDS